MILFWRGWGIAVLFVWFFWLFASGWWVIAVGSSQPDPNEFNRLVGLSFGLTGLSVLAIERCRAKRGATAVDEFMFLKLRIWVYILLVLALAMEIQN